MPEGLVPAGMPAWRRRPALVRLTMAGTQRWSRPGPAVQVSMVRPEGLSMVPGSAALVPMLPGVELSMMPGSAAQDALAPLAETSMVPGPAGGRWDWPVRQQPGRCQER